MRLSKRTQYGLRAMICLSDSYNRGFLQSRELAGREKLPIKFLESILSALTRGRFLTSRLGSAGGFRLARPPKEIFVGSILARLETKSLMENLEPESADGGAGTPGEVAVRVLHERLSEAVREVLENMTLAELAEEVAQASRGGQMYYI